MGFEKMIEIINKQRQVSITSNNNKMVHNDGMKRLIYLFLALHFVIGYTKTNDDLHTKLIER